MKLKTDIVESKEKNIFIILNGSLNSFTDKKERQLFIDTLCEIKRKTSKNIVVLQHGDDTEITMERGVKYISVNNSAIAEDDHLSAIRNTKHIEITVAEKKLEEAKTSKTLK